MHENITLYFELVFNNYSLGGFEIPENLLG